MMSSTLKNIIVYFFAPALLGIAFLLIKQHDDRILGARERNTFPADSSILRLTDDEMRVAKQFSDSTLPELKQRGLILQYRHTEVETVITVNGRLWIARSQFFKESFLTRLLLYNQASGLSAASKIMDEKNGHLYAQIVPPDQKIIYD